MSFETPDRPAYRPGDIVQRLRRLRAFEAIAARSLLADQGFRQVAKENLERAHQGLDATLEAARHGWERPADGEEITFGRDEARDLAAVMGYAAELAQKLKIDTAQPPLRDRVDPGEFERRRRAIPEYQWAFLETLADLRSALDAYASAAREGDQTRRQSRLNELARTFEAIRHGLERHPSGHLLARYVTLERVRGVGAEAVRRKVDLHERYVRDAYRPAFAALAELETAHPHVQLDLEALDRRFRRFERIQRILLLVRSRFGAPSEDDE